MIRGVTFFLLATAGPALGAAAAVDLPRPALEAFEPVAAAHLRTARADFEARIAGGGAPGELAEAWGDLAMVYYGYELHELAAAGWENALRLAPEDGRWLYLLGLLKRIEGDWAQAKELLEKAVETDPANAAARIHLGRVLLDLGDVDGAESEFRRLRELLPGSAAATLGLARVELARKRYEEAVLWGRRTLALEPGANVAHHHIGLAFRGLGDLESARRHLAISGARDVSIPDPLTDGLADLVQGAAIQAKHGVEAARSGRHGLAIRYFRRAVEIAPEQASHRYNLAVSLREDGQHRRAIETLTRLVESSPEHRDGHFNLASLLAREGDAAGAARHYRKAADIDPTDRVARIEWAGAISHLGQVTRAREELEALVASDEDDAESRLGLATVLLQQGRRSEAAVVVSRGLDRDVADGEWAALAAMRGRISEEAGDAESARADYEAALARDPGFDDGRLRLGRLLAREGEYSAAAAHFRRLASVDPGNAEYQISLAIALELTGGGSELVASLEEATTHLPESVALRHLLARALVSCPRGPWADVGRGLALARQVMDREPSTEHAETVAAALAANADFGAAAEWQQRVMERWNQQGEAPRAEAAKTRLESYRAGLACPPTGEES